MSVSKMTTLTVFGFAAMLIVATPATSGDKIDIKTPGASIDIFDGNKVLKAGDAKIKVKPGKRDDCLRIKAGDAEVSKGRIKHGKCKS